MKTTVKIHLYYMMVTVCLILTFYYSGYPGRLPAAAAAVLVLLGWVRAGSMIGSLERSMKFPVGSIEEAECLSHSGSPLLCRMADRIREHMDSLKAKYTARVEDRQSKINSLQSQINPHFLYNTLECIRSEAIYRDCDNIAKMAKSLAAFYRYSISRKENVVTVEEELENIRNYIMIQNYRFEDKFLFDVKLQQEDKRALSCQIPKMTIQPIVENAIFHGLETKKGECRVEITICMTEKLMLLMISDNGSGMNEEQLDRLRHRMEQGEEGAEDEAGRGNGIALYNVNQRIKLLFGNAYGLHIYSVEGEGTDVEIQMPIQIGRERE